LGGRGARLALPRLLSPLRRDRTVACGRERPDVLYVWARPRRGGRSTGKRAAMLLVRTVVGRSAALMRQTHLPLPAWL
jgi:hypothetical protein